MGKENDGTVPGSFRDPSGFLFRRDDVIYRQVNTVYQSDFDHFVDSGLYQSLVDAGLLIPHREVDLEPEDPANAYKTIRPEQIPFISYPYEWCFSQLKDAARVTLQVHKTAFKYGMCLKDASAYNIQFRKGKAVFIDTLSFQRYRAGQVWSAYRQFCQHFLAPLALMSYRDVRLGQLLRVHLDGIPLDMASALLPLSSRFSFALLCHIHLHARSQAHFAGKTFDTNRHTMSRLSLVGLIDNLESAVERLNWEAKGTEWADYYRDNNYSAVALEHKKQIVKLFLDEISARNVWDLGGNVGVFTRIASDQGIPVVSCDIDPAAVERNYLECRAHRETNVLPLLVDLTNPSPGIGWQNTERTSLLERGSADTVFALALIHHLAIANNLPFNRIACFFGKICNWLLVEFVPKSDSQVKKMLSARTDIFPGYTQPDFEAEFQRSFEIRHAVRIADSERTLYCMRNRRMQA